MAREKGSKTNRHQAIEKLIADVMEIDADSNLTVGQKNAKHRLAAKRYMTAIRDGRKTADKQVKDSTLKRYVTDVRNAVTDKQWFHYSFNDTIEKLIKKYPLLKPELESIKDAKEVRPLPVDAVRVKCKQTVQKMLDSKRLIEPLQNIDVVETGWKKQVLDLAEKDSYGWIEKTANREKKHGYWVDELKEVVNSKAPKKSLDSLIAKIIQANNSDLYNKVRYLKIDHEIMRHLRLDNQTKAINSDNDKQALSKKKKSEKVIDYCELMPTINGLIHVESWVPEYWQALTVGIIMATGRRPIEVLLQGRFRKVGPYALSFSGQAKRSGGVNYDEENIIYSLVPASEVLEALEKLRGTVKCKELAALKPQPNLSVNQQVGNRTSTQLNAFVDNLVVRNNWPDMSAKHGRALYAKVCVELFRHHDPRWKGYMEDAMVSELLGHDDERAQQYYRDWHIKNAGNDYLAIEYPQRGPIIEELEKLNEVMREADGNKKKPDGTPIVGARENLHEKVKAVLKEAPETEITNRFIRNNLGGSPHTIRDYLLLAEPALQNEFDLVQFIGKQVGTIKAIDEPEPMLVMGGQPVVEQPAAAVTVTEQPAVEQVTPTIEPTAKKEPEPKKSFPKFRFKDNGGGSWHVTVTENGVESEYFVVAESLREAGESAWLEHKEASAVQEPIIYSAEVFFCKGAIIPVIEVEVAAVDEAGAKIEAEKQIRAGGIQTAIKKIVIKKRS